MSSMVKAIDTDRFLNPSIRIEKGAERERGEKKTKMHFGAFRRMSNFVHEGACFAGDRRDKGEKYDDAEACAVIR